DAAQLLVMEAHLVDFRRTLDRGPREGADGATAGDDRHFHVALRWRLTPIAGDDVALGVAHAQRRRPALVTWAWLVALFGIARRRAPIVIVDRRSRTRPQHLRRGAA